MTDEQIDVHLIARKRFAAKMRAWASERLAPPSEAPREPVKTPLEWLEEHAGDKWPDPISVLSDEARALFHR